MEVHFLTGVKYLFGSREVKTFLKDFHGIELVKNLFACEKKCCYFAKVWIGVLSFIWQKPSLQHDIKSAFGI